MNILEEIAGKTRERVDEAKRKVPVSLLLERIRERQELERKGLERKRLENKELKNKGLERKQRQGFLERIRMDGMSYICEVKRASPSKGLIAQEFPYLDIAREYEEAGASAISCLTEPFYFQGRNEYLEAIAEEVSVPVLRKDFTVDEYMIYEARALGASAVLLICAILDDKQLSEYGRLAKELGMDALVEAHDEEEVDRAVMAGARIIGVNNRDLRTFQVDVRNSIRLRNLVPEDVVFVSESGIKTHEDIQILYDHQVNGVLIGETLMRSPDKRKALEKLNGGRLV